MFASAHRLALVPAIVMALASRLSAQGAPISGHVRNQAGQPIASATISIVELKRGVSSGTDGAFQLNDVPAGRYTIAVSRLGYASSAQRVTIEAAAVDLTVTLEVAAVRVEPINVTASRAPMADDASPFATSTLSGDEVHAEGGVSLAHSVAKLPGVRSVTSGQQIGKPMIRGLFGPRVLVLTDGSRLEDYSWSDEDAPSVDARLADRVEVIRGPASVLYGSDAMGGVVNVIATPLPAATGAAYTRTAFELYGASNNHEFG
ncbi:MAG TPA: TonB-dependent receptor plug domain-containing protein, partial [Gemmatimonadaceae bacterium]